MLFQPDILYLDYPLQTNLCDIYEHWDEPSWDRTVPNKHGIVWELYLIADILFCIYNICTGIDTVIYNYIKKSWITAASFLNRVTIDWFHYIVHQYTQ